MPRGYAAVGFVSPKCNHNVGAILRAAQCYDVDLVLLSGHRYKSQSTDTLKTWRHIPVIHNLNSIFDAAPYGAVPIAVDLVDNAIPLPTFKHPQRALYIFGPEDGTLGSKYLDRCAHRLMVPTKFCMNLAATVNVILYDRLLKSQEIPNGPIIQAEVADCRQHKD